MQLKKICLVGTVAALLAGIAAGCAGTPGIGPLFGSPFPNNGTGGGGTGQGPGGTGSGGTGGGATNVGELQLDPCAVSDPQKFIRISMRNQASIDFVHYFLLLVAFVETDGQEGAVCAEDISLYTQFGYRLLASDEAFGSLCLPAGSLVYFHQSGRFRTTSGSGNTGLGSAIAPASGTNPTYDEFFSASGRQVPVPNWIIFHNPGTGDGARLQISIPNAAPCLEGGFFPTGGSICTQDAFYYVNSGDSINGSSALGAGSGRRVPAEIQGSFCECGGVAQPVQQLALTGTPDCFEFTRGGSIQYVFLRDDRQPPFPQLVWRVNSASGQLVQDFDPRSGVR